jgi:hypothetical protein
MSKDAAGQAKPKREKKAAPTKASAGAAAKGTK